MTGISSEDMARAALTQLIALNVGRGIWGTDVPYIKLFDVCMMNSDYSIGVPIRRDRLYKVLVEEYGLWANYEPTIYQGVNTKFFWNKMRPETAPPGICVCPTLCEGGADGSDVGKCKKITISPFRTGSIIITGAKQMCQLMDAYDFMNTLFSKHPEVLREDAVDTLAVESTRKKMPSPTSAEGILRLKMRASPRNIVRLPAITASNAE